MEQSRTLIQEFLEHIQEMLRQGHSHDDVLLHAYELLHAKYNTSPNYPDHLREQQKEQPKVENSPENSLKQEYLNVLAQVAPKPQYAPISITKRVNL